MLDELKKKLRLGVNLPSPPAIAQNIIALTSSPDVDIAQIAVAISKDPGLTAKILRVANSSMYSRGRTSHNLRQALQLLGLRATTTLALSFSLIGTYNGGKGTGVDYPGFWRRAILAAAAARLLANRAAHVGVDEVFLGALLQDLAVLAIDRVQPDFYATLPVPASHTQLLQYECQALGVDHAHLTAWLLRHWKLPEALCAAVEASHDPTMLAPESPHGAAARCIALGSECAEALLAGERQTDWPQLAGHTREWLNLGPETLAEVMSALVAEIPETEILFDTTLLEPHSAQAIVEQAQELLTLRNLQALEQITTLEASSEQLASRMTMLEDKHRRDPLTGVFHRGHLDEVLEKEFRAATDGGWPLSVVFIDLDRFKLVNDTYGHPVGDVVLVATAKLLVDLVRDTDLVARYGGEEFVILFPGLDAGPAAFVCERILTRLREARHSVAGRLIQSTASLGLATHTVCTPFSSVAQLVEAADRSVYAAKRAGRDRLVRYEPASLARTA
ncbi:MAG TPA: HDOD domain-containing protein [Steroidobacteraceae bacterium]|nr:HDOD domain-containing protein [Steroidobacteraceae bacterium]HRX89774.1 HDOD domain-containing protein [Steroidobacteraceae bacterium]